MSEAVAQWKADTIRLLSSTLGGKSVTIQSATIDYADIPISLTSSSTIIQTATVHIFERRGSLTKDAKGLVAEATHQIFLRYTTTVSVGNRIFENGQTDYYEVLSVARFEDHKEALARKVENR